MEYFYAMKLPLLKAHSCSFKTEVTFPLIQRLCRFLLFPSHLTFISILGKAMSVKKEPSTQLGYLWLSSVVVKLQY